jgi:hypothetical protein
MYALSALENRHQSLSALAVSSGPLSQRMNAGANALGDEALQRGDRLVGVDASVTLDRQRLAGELVDDMQQLQDPPVGGLIELEVQRPHVIRLLGAQPLGRDGRGPEPLALAAPLRHPQALLAPQPLRALAMQHPSLFEQPLMRTAIPPPRTIARDLPQLRAQRRVVARDQWRVALRAAGLTGISARPPLAEPRRSSSIQTAWRRRDELTNFPWRSP